MTNHSNESTLQVQGFTPYAQIPRWILRSQGDLSGNSVQLYGVIMSYADNDTKTAFPSREKLAEDMGVSVATIKRCIKELEAYGALIVERRRNKRTGNFYANHYTLVFNSPRVTDDPRRQVTDDPITTPTVELDPPSSTPDLRSGATVARAHSVSTHAPSEPGNLPGPVRALLRRKIHKIGVEMSNGHGFHDDHVSELWQSFIKDLEHYGHSIPGIDELIGDMDNGAWSVGRTEADPYQAGAKLNKMIHAAQNM